LIQLEEFGRRHWIDALDRHRSAPDREIVRRQLAGAREVAFRRLDAAGLRVIARARRTLPPRCPLTLRSPTRQVRLVLEVSGLAGVCPIEDPPR
jgi:hypothetical protein